MCCAFGKGRLDGGMAGTEWLQGVAGSPPLRGQEVHGWVVSVATLAPNLESLHRTLSADEKERAERFHFERDRICYVVVRGLLRTLLGRYLGCSASEVEFSYNEHGKPAVALEQAKVPIEFNVSHSHGMAILGFTLHQSIGVDIEQIRPEVATEDLAKRFFAPAEIKALGGLPEERRARGFFNCWTRKEAYIKARGIGLSLPLDQFAVSVTDGVGALLSVAGDPEGAQRWSIRDIAAPPGHVAAIAVEGPIAQLEVKTYV